MANDWEAEGLLDGIEGEDARAVRRKLLDALAGDGVELDELKQAVEEDRLALLPVERVLDDGAVYSAREIAEKTGLDLEDLRAQWQAAGLARADPDEPAFSEQDLESAKVVKQFLDAGVPAEALREFARVLGNAMSRVAQAGNALVADSTLQSGDADEYELAIGFAEAAREFLPKLGPLLHRSLELHTREQLRSVVVGRAELDGERAPGVRRIAVAFADIVGYTRLGEELSPDRLGTVARKLAGMAAEVANSPVKLIKTIGDAVMLVSTEPAPLLDAVLELVERAENNSDEMPPLKAGAATGDALNRNGDWYGRPVNLASRVTSTARPSSVLITGDLKDLLSEEEAARFAFSFAGKRKLKGIAGETDLHRVRRHEGEEP
jgi:adenylate cyclase